MCCVSLGNCANQVRKDYGESLLVSLANHELILVSFLTGCQLVALELLRSYQFPRPPQRQARIIPKPTSPSIAIVAPTQFVEPDMSSLFDMSTPKPRSKPLPPTVMAIAEDTKEKEEEEEEEVKEREKRLFREATGAKPKIETKATVDAFSFDAFGF